MEVERIEAALLTLVEKERIKVLEDVSSTMDEVKSFLPQAENRTGFCGAVVALSQTAGRGRQGREWVSDKGKGIYFSALFKIAIKDQSILGLLPLVTGIEIKERFKNYSPQIKLKWPNDLIVETKAGPKKLAGLLLEATHEAKTVNVIIGIGLNLRKIDLPQSISLEELGENELDSAKVSLLILESAIAAVGALNKISTKDFAHQYNSSMLFFNQEVSFIENAKNCISGINRGIDSDGSLLLETATGTINLYSGEVHSSLNGPRGSAPSDFAK